jgi:hypothetical protein
MSVPFVPDTFKIPYMGGVIVNCSTDRVSIGLA